MLEGDQLLFVMIYVNDMLIFTNSRILKKKLMKFLIKKFNMKDLGETKHLPSLRLFEYLHICIVIVYWLERSFIYIFFHAK